MQIVAPYLLFIGDATDELSIKMARGVADWRPELCIGEMKVEGCTVSTGLASTSIEEAAKQGAKTFVLGFANSGGILAEKWHPYIIKALEFGMDVVSGLHDKLTDVAELVEVANIHNRQLLDIRHPEGGFKTGTGAKRSGQRLLTVGTDCSVGKMYTSLSLEKSMKAKGLNVDFRATGQCGILIAGQGLAIDCIIADFISGATETLSPDNQDDHWDIIEGQGSLSHPAFAGVSTGLLHGSQPDAIVVCHALNRHHMRGLPHTSIPSIADTIALNLQAAKLTNPNVQLAGITVNTSSVSVEQGRIYCQGIAKEFGIPCVDPVRDGTDAIIDYLLHNQQIAGVVS
ncbi:N-acetyltransferase DgcN [Thalassotalea sediminis]|uniref:N-acetyltransferase DgcN n=1 Tax=Thalassotalea sediminis TaxID=1759089 RepID=UPI0025742A2D|nr:N-acetyltransferase DgcN [Thalassotalea sediminis]